MNNLPPEIKEIIFENISSEMLHLVIINVCIEWSEIARGVLQKRVAHMLDTVHKDVLQDLVQKTSPSNSNDEIKLLLNYENSRLPKNFRITSSKHSSESGSVRILSDCVAKRQCDCSKPGVCIVRSLQFMECHQLVVVQIPERMAFYSLQDFQNGQSSNFSSSEYEYKTSVKDSKLTSIWIDNNTHAAFSVYRDFVICQETTRALILFRVVSVNHGEKHLVLENIRRIFLPLWSCAVSMIEDKVIALFTTGTVGVWNKINDNISISRNACSSQERLRRMRFCRIYRLYNLIFIKNEAQDELQPVAEWTVFDSNKSDDGFSLIPVDVSKMFPSWFFCHNESITQLIDIFGTANSLIFHLRAVTRDSTRVTSIGSKVFVCRLKKLPSLEDFTEHSLSNEISGECSGVREVYVPKESLSQPISAPRCVDYDSTASTTAIRLVGIAVNNDKYKDQCKISVSSYDFMI